MSKLGEKKTKFETKFKQIKIDLDIFGVIKIKLDIKYKNVLKIKLMIGIHKKVILLN